MCKSISLKQGYRLGKKYKYPQCCIWMYLIRTCTWYHIIVFLRNNRIVPFALVHNTDPGVKCPYHYLQSAFRGQITVYRYLE